MLTLLASLFSDAGFTLSKIKTISPAYGALVLHGAASAALDHTFGVLAPAMGARSASCVSTLGATVVCLPFYALKIVMVCGLLV